ncbi:MAG: metallophosphoesterase family protein [Promethearchaeota archaeon]
MVKSLGKIKISKDVDIKKRLVIISDTHIARSGSAFNLHAFNVGIEKINKIRDVSLYLHLGDLTHSGTLLDYEHTLTQLEKFKPISESPMLILIGNHDAKNVGYLLFEEMIGKRYFEYEDEEIYIIGIDSTKPDLAGGIIHHEVIDSVKTKLEDPIRKDKLKIVCFHHQLIPIPNTGKERSAIDDSGNMLKMLLEAETDLVLNGHRHTSNLYNLSSSQKNMFIFNSGTFSCNKTRYRELFTYAIIDIEGHSITFKVLPIFENQNIREIHREITYYEPIKVNTKRKTLFRVIQICNSLINEKDAGKKVNLDIAINKINEFENIDLVVHTGNLTAKSYENEFFIANEKLNKIKFPWVAIPGPTDSKPPAWEFWREYIGDLNPSYEADIFYFQGINSTTQDSSNGFIGRKKLSDLIEKVLSLSHKKIFVTSCFHTLIPTPLSVWRTELIDSGDILSSFARSQIDLVLNSSPSISFNLKVENTVISNGGNISGNRFPPVIVETEIFDDGLTIIKEHSIHKKESRIIGTHKTEIMV